MAYPTYPYSGYQPTPYYPGPVQDQLAQLDFPCTKIIVAQRISTTKRADKVVIIENGRITQVGSHQELARQPGYYREVFLLQNGESEKEAV